MIKQTPAISSPFQTAQAGLLLNLGKAFTTRFFKDSVLCQVRTDTGFFYNARSATVKSDTHASQNREV